MIQDYGIIGDCRSAALISKDGSLDWLCWPRFDSPFIFGSLLDEEAGQWRIQPVGKFTASRRYIDHTNVLETTFHTPNGLLTLTDFMPVADEDYKRSHLMPDHEIIRIVRCISGRVNLEISYAPRLSYGKAHPKIQNKGRLGLRADLGEALLTLHSQTHFTVAGARATSMISLHAGESRSFSLTYSTEAPDVIPNLDSSKDVLERTINWWKAWAAHCTYQGPYSEHVLRSVLTLKLLQFASSGAFVASPTTSLPERIGGDLNWDYRYCWLRDASLTVQALSGTGFIAEAEAFGEWMLHATRLTQPKLMVMYDVYGNLAKRERELREISGYERSRPVRVGNQARNQKQLDVYGEVVSGAARVVRLTGRIDRETQKVLIGFGHTVCKHWSESDSGIWEHRSKPAVHTHSRLLCWLALHELLELHREGYIKEIPLELFANTRDKIRHSIETDSWDSDIQSYISEVGSQQIDSTLLLIAIQKFEQASSPRLEATYKRVQATLQAGNGLLYRYRRPGMDEGAFGLSSFWGVEFLALRGDHEQACASFESLLHYANDVGLFAEEVDPKTGSALGNFPQAFTHVGLINAALALQPGRGQR